MCYLVSLLTSALDLYLAGKPLSVKTLAVFARVENSANTCKHQASATTQQAADKLLLTGQQLGICPASFQLF